MRYVIKTSETRTQEFSRAEHEPQWEQDNNNNNN